MGLIGRIGGSILKLHQNTTYASMIKVRLPYEAKDHGSCIV